MYRAAPAKGSARFFSLLDLRIPKSNLEFLGSDLDMPENFHRRFAPASQENDCITVTIVRT